MSDNLVAIVLIVAAATAAGFLGANAERSIMRRQAIEHNAAVYDPYTAAFTWRKNDE